MAEFVNKPLRRHSALAPLSRDHYVGLVQAQHLIKVTGAEGNDVERRRVLAEFLDAWEAEIAVHMRDEERLLPPCLDETDRERLLGEHSLLADLVARAKRERAQVSPDAALLRELGETLERHIRWEERELFSHLEERCDAATLGALERETGDLEARRRRGRR